MSEARFDPTVHKAMERLQLHDPSMLLSYISDIIGKGQEPEIAALGGMFRLARAFMLAPEETYAWFRFIFEEDPLLLEESAIDGLAEIACWLYEHGDTRTKVS